MTIKNDVPIEFKRNLGCIQDKTRVYGKNGKLFVAAVEMLESSTSAVFQARGREGEGYP